MFLERRENIVSTPFDELSLGIAGDVVGDAESCRYTYGRPAATVSTQRFTTVLNSST